MKQPYSIFCISNGKIISSAWIDEPDDEAALNRDALAQILAEPGHKDHFAAVKLALGIQGMVPAQKSEHHHVVDTVSLAEQIKMLEAQLPASVLRRLPHRDEPADEEDWTAP